MKPGDQITNLFSEGRPLHLVCCCSALSWAGPPSSWRRGGSGRAPRGTTAARPSQPVAGSCCGCCCRGNGRAGWRAGTPTHPTSASPPPCRSRSLDPRPRTCWKRQWGLRSGLSFWRRLWRRWRLPVESLARRHRGAGLQRVGGEGAGAEAALRAAERANTLHGYAGVPARFTRTLRFTAGKSLQQQRLISIC